MSGLTECAQEIFSLKIPGQQTQREKILWMQQNRINGTWVKCFQCQKWRYLKNAFDPVDIPDKWQCSMNLDNKFNNCQETQSPFNDNTMIKLKYTAGSLVWVNSNKYSKWPGIVDDDPEYAQFYWLSSNERRASLYHVVFIDGDHKLTSRQWFSEDELIPFTWHNSHIGPAKHFRLDRSVRLAREALDMNVFQRLQKFSFARQYRGHIFSFGHAMRSFVVSEGQDLENESDCTLLSCTDSEDEDYYKNLRDHPGLSTRKKKGVISPYDYFKRLKEKKLELESDSHSDNDNRIERANSVRPSENDLRRRRASSVDPKKNTLKRTSLDCGLPRTTDPKQKTPRQKASSISPKERPFEYSMKENKKRDSMGLSESKGRGRVSPVMRDDFNSRNKRSSSVVRDVESKSRNKRSSSVVRNVDSKSKNKRSSSVVHDVDSKSRNKRSSSVAHDVDSKSKNKRSSSVVHDVDSKSRNKRSSSVVHNVDCKSRNKRSSSVLRGIDSNHRNKRASSVSYNESQNNRQKRKAALAAPDDYFKPEASNQRPNSSYHNDSSTKAEKKSLDSSGGYYDSNSRSRRACSIIDSYSENRRTKSSSTTPKSDYESNSRSRKGSSKNARTDYECNSQSRKDSSKVGDDSSEKRRGRRAASVVPINYCETNSRRKRSSSVAPVKHRESSSTSKRSSFIAPVDYHCEPTPKNKKTTPTASMSLSDYQNKDGGYLSKGSDYHRKDMLKSQTDRSYYSESTQQKKTPTASSSQTSYLNREMPKFHSSGFSNISGNASTGNTSSTSLGNPSGRRRLRSQTRNNVEENYKMSVKNDSRDMSNSLVIRNTSPISTITPITNHSSSDIPIYGHGLIRKTVYEVTTKRWKYTSSNGEYYYQDFVTESHHSRPY